MKHVVEGIAALIAGLAWLAGIVLAKGALSTAAAVFFPPWAWYLVVERAMAVAGWLA